MGLIYNPNESKNLVSNFNSNIATCEQIILDLKRGNDHLMGALNGNLLSGAAFNAGQGLFMQLVMPTVTKADTVIQELKAKLNQYIQYTGDAGEDILDEDKLNHQLQELRNQQTMLTSQINSFRDQAKASKTPDITVMCHNYANTLFNYTGTLQDDIRKVEEQLKKLHELNMKIAPLFDGVMEKFSTLTTVISAIGSGSFDSSGKFSVDKKNRITLANTISIQDGAWGGIEKFLETIDDTLPNSDTYMKVYSSGNPYFKNTQIYWDGEGFGKAFSNSVLKKGVKTVTVNRFGVGKATISGLGVLSFGVDYYQNRADGESVGTAFAHTATTTAVAGAGTWALGTVIGAAAGAGIGGPLVAGAATLIVSNPIGWAVGAGILVSGFTKLAYDYNFLGLKDTAKTIGKVIDSGLKSMKSIWSWGKKKNA